jgi:hypothetical protein
MNKFQLITAPLLLCATIGFSTTAFSSETADKAKSPVAELGTSTEKLPGRMLDTAEDAGKSAVETTESFGKGFGSTTEPKAQDAKGK